VLLRWREDLKLEQPGAAESILRRRVEAYLDQGHGSCYLKDLSIASMVQDALLFHDEVKYRLAAWVVMPNHVHMLCKPRPEYGLAQIMHSLKSFTSLEANKMLNRSGRFWQKEYFDRYIRSAKHYAKVSAYIENNPVKACLCERPQDWPFSSAWFRKN
jgi:REP element-mobilizing transposase RayT